MEKAGSRIMVCGSCGTKNRIPYEKTGERAVCGKCGSAIDTRREAELMHTLRCMECGAKNRVPAGKIDDGAVCGKCRTALATEFLSAPQPFMVTDATFDQQILKSPLPSLIFAMSPT